MAIATYTLPFPPSVNHYWRRVGPRTLISRDGRRYRSAVLLATQGCKKGLLGDLAVHIHLFMPDRRRRDIDNCLKALLDALQHAGVYQDDYQISLLTIRRMGVHPDGQAMVAIRESSTTNKEKDE